MPYSPAENSLIAQPIDGVDASSTVQRHPIGTIVRAKDPTYGFGTFIYLRGVASLAQGNMVAFNQLTGNVTRWDGTNQLGEPLAVAMAAHGAGTFGWYQIQGAAIVSISGTVAARDRAFWQATGVVSSTLVASKQVMGMSAASANGVPSAGFAIYTIMFPHVQGQLT